jgi:hypothetical protein
LVAVRGVAVDAWQWDSRIEEVGAVRMVPDTVWQWQWWRSCCMKWQWQRWQWQRWQWFVGGGAVGGSGCVAVG